MLYEEVEMVMNGRLGGESFNIVLWLMCRWGRRLLLSLGFWGPRGKRLVGV